MVVKWSADKDQFILNHLLTDTSIKINNDVLDAMIQTWRMYPPLSYSFLPFPSSQPVLPFLDLSTLHLPSSSLFILASPTLLFNPVSTFPLFTINIPFPTKLFFISNLTLQLQLPPSAPPPPERP